MTPSLPQPQPPEWDALLRRLVAALRHRFPDLPDPSAAEDAATSAIRTWLRRLRDEQQTPLPTDELLAWLIRAGSWKFIDRYRHHNVERRHVEGVGRHTASLRDQAGEQENRDDVLQRCRRAVAAVYDQATPEERIVLDGKRDGRILAEIADVIAREIPERKGKCSQPTVCRVWANLCVRLQQHLAEGEADP
jgi:hypothetical protein